MLLVVLHGFEVVDRRTLRVHQAITFVVASYAAGLRIDDALGWWIAAWGVAFFASLLLTGRPRASSNETGAVGTRLDACDRRRGSALRRSARSRCLSVVPVPDGPASLGLPALSPDDAPVAPPGALASPDGSPAPTGGDVGDDRGTSAGRRIPGIHRIARHERARRPRRRDRHAGARSGAGVLAGPDLQRLRRAGVDGVARHRHTTRRPDDRRSRRRSATTQRAGRRPRS